MCAALVVGNRVDLIHDHGFHVAQNGPAAFRGQQDVERLRRGYQDVRRTPQHQPPLVCQRVAGAHHAADFRHQQATLGGQLHDLAQWRLQIFLDVIAQRL